MKRMRRTKISLLVCLIILLGFSSVGAISYNTYSKIIKDDIKNISILTATNIYSDIRNQLTKPIFVSLTMANDNFVKEWIAKEKNNLSALEHQKIIIDYLNGLQLKYNYNSVFLISDYSKNYYHFNGINKVVSESNQHDRWYYDFVKSNSTYDLDVDTDEANNNILSVFINCRITDEQGELLGVTGVGLELNKVQELLSEFQNDFQLEIMLFDKNGMVQVHSDTSLIEKINVFKFKELEENKAGILNNKIDTAFYKYKDGKSQGYMITKYIEDLDWYLLVKKDTSVLTKSFQNILLKDMLIYLAVIFFITFIIFNLIKNNDKSLLHMAKTDILTGLANRRSFNEAIKKIFSNHKEEEACFVYIFDIDNLKVVNDKYGHLIGDKVIYRIGNYIKDYLKENGEVFRWGGDEFAGFIFTGKDKLEDMLKDIFDYIRDDAELNKYGAGISMGITLLQKTDTSNSLLKRADQALYLAKDNGKNRYMII